MLVSEFDYDLPPELIAQEPLADRAASRLLHLLRSGRRWEDRRFREFPELLRSDDLVVFNNTRVFPARLYGHRSGARAQPLSPRNPASKQFLKGTVEVLLTSPADEENSRGLALMNADRKEPAQISVHQRSSAVENPLLWHALVRPGRKIGIGERLYFGEHGELEAEVIARGEYGERTLRFLCTPERAKAARSGDPASPVPDFFAIVERIGHVPLPPYIARPDQPTDRERYQTVYARRRGSVAAPTAGLHFTPEILESIRARGIETAEITLHVGLGTFQPVHAEVVEENRLHREWYRVSDEAARQINSALRAGRRVVAVGTTTVRTLEYAASVSPNTQSCHSERSEESAFSETAAVHPGSGEADIFIYPGFQFRVVGALLTNFHLPKSTLLMLVSAFAGRDFTLDAYRHAVAQRYRFYSYGDCMFIE